MIRNAFRELCKALGIIYPELPYGGAASLTLEEQERRLRLKARVAKAIRQNEQRNS
jgi:hypothetical protein